VGEVEAGGTKSFDLYVLVDPSFTGGSLTNTVLVLSSPSNVVPPGPPPGLPSSLPQGPATWDPNTASNTATKITSAHVSHDLSIKKTSDADVYKPSSRVKYTITVVNNGPSDAANVTVTDYLPSTKQAKYLWDTGGCIRTNTTLTCNIGPMESGEIRQFDVYMTVFGSNGVVSNTATITGGASPYDGNLSNNTSIRKIVVQGKKFTK
jgi:uncharacterized repeat protein (TIGR01451 family)